MRFPQPSLDALLPRDGAGASRDGTDDVLDRIDGHAIRKAFLLDRMRLEEPWRVQQALELARLDLAVYREAKRFGIRVPDDALRLAVLRELARSRRAYAKGGGQPSGYSRYLESNYGMDEERFQDRVRFLAWRKLLRAFTVRYFSRRRGSLTLRYFVAADRDAAERARRDVRNGADFAALAKGRSQDPSAPGGGLLASIDPESGHPAVKLAGTLPRGSSSAVARIAGAKGPRYAFVRVEERLAADERPFEQQLDEIRAELARRPISAGELARFVAGR